jgi:hypothetical protein
MRGGSRLTEEILASQKRSVTYGWWFVGCLSDWLVSWLVWLVGWFVGFFGLVWFGWVGLG